MNKKQKIEDSSIAQIQENEITKKATIDLLNLLCSDWLPPFFFPYLTLKDISKLDTVICNRSQRPQWLETLEKYFCSTSSECHSWNNQLVEWIAAKKLHFACLEIYRGYSRISNDNMYRLAQQCPDLKKLYIIYEGYEDDAKLQYLIPFCYKLESIGLVRMKLSQDHCVWLGACEQLESIKASLSELSAASIKALFKNKRKLKTLELTDTCHGVVLLELGTNCPLLEHLGTDYLVDITATHIEVFTQACTKLKAVKFSNLFDDDDAPVGLKNKLVEGLGKNCPLLESLTINGGNENGISEEALKSLAQGCPLLKQLRIPGVRMSSACMKHLVNHFPMLAVIDLSYSNISDDVLLELSKSKSLISLNISYCHQVTDEGIDALVKGCGSSLESLCIGNCTRLTDVSLSSISEQCPHLHTIDVDYNHTVMTSIGIMRLINKCEKLIHFDNCYSSSLDMSLIYCILEERIKRKRMNRLVNICH